MNAIVRALTRRIVAVLTFVVAALGGSTAFSSTPPAAISIAQIPLTVTTPVHPQIMIAVGNSSSMDGTLSGAIMTGSGALDPSLNALQASSSPVSYAVPSGFTPPVDPGSNGNAPYTSNINGVLVDNSPSRLNVAKAGIAALLKSFLPNADFGLIAYNTTIEPSLAGNIFVSDALTTYLFTTWVFLQSPPGGQFIFTSNQVPGNRYSANPCYNYKSLDSSSPVYTDCHAIELSGKVTGDVSASQYIQISASSDDPNINDVLFQNPIAAMQGGVVYPRQSNVQDPICLAYGGPTSGHTTTLSTYNTLPGPKETWSSMVNNCTTVASPSNAGYTAQSQQVLYVERGFGYDAQQAYDTGSVLVPLQSAGLTPTPSSIAQALNQFSGSLAPETNSLTSGEIKSSADQSPIAGLLKGAADYYQGNSPAVSNGCAPQRYVILVTDGLPTLDLVNQNWPPPGSASAVQLGMQVVFNADGSLNAAASSTNNGHSAVNDSIAELTALNAAGIKTYIIGLGAGVDPAQNPVAAQVLKAMAIAGGTGDYLPATSPTALTADFEQIMINLLAATQSKTSVAVNSSRLNVNSVEFSARYTEPDLYQDWTGNLIASTVDPGTGLAGQTLWSGQSMLDSQDWDTGRLMATWDPVTQQGISFRWNPDKKATTGIGPSAPLGAALSTFTPDTNGSDVLNYLRGNSAQEMRNGGQFRNRAHKLGDIVDSAPLYVGAPSDIWQSASYLKFLTSGAKRPPVVYVGSNDGMLHAFDASTGKERFAFIPNGVFPNLANLADPNYNRQHRFYVNGSPAAADVQFSDSNWHTIIVGGESAGGNTVYALDVTDPGSITTESALAKSVLWEFSDSNMGLSFGTPVIAYTSAGWMVFFGNGYNSPTESPRLYSVDPATGHLISSIDLCSAASTANFTPCDPTVANGLSSVTVVNGSGVSTAAQNVVYAGDLQGNLWRVDITDSNPAKWVTTVLFQARDPKSNKPQPITTKPVTTLNPQYPQVSGPLVIAATGQLLGWPDLGTSQIQTLYGIFDPSSASSTSSLPTRNNLVSQQLAFDTVGTTVVITEPVVNRVTYPTDRGWLVDLGLLPGGRVVADPQLEPGGAVVATVYQPATDPCTGGGHSYELVLNYATGGAFPNPELDLNHDGQVNSKDATTKGLSPVGFDLGETYAASAAIVSAPGPNDPKWFKLTTTSAVPTLSSAQSSTSSSIATASNVQVQSMQDVGAAKQRTAWWEVRH